MESGSISVVIYTEKLYFTKILLILEYFITSFFLNFIYLNNLILLLRIS